jgi:hypothetical protein
MRGIVAAFSTAAVMLFTASPGQNRFTASPDSVRFHTEDISTFWNVFDKTRPDFDPKTIQKEYINVGSDGLKGFLKNRIENGKNLSKVIKGNLAYYEAVRESSLSIDRKRERLYECFRNLRNIYPAAVFPDVYFVIGARNSGGTVFPGGLIIGAEMFGSTTAEFQPPLDIGYVDEVVSHELIHFQQKYAANNTLLAQCIREGSADFLGELIAGDHSNKKVYAYGEEHIKELWEEFLRAKGSSDWSNWLYYSKDKGKPKDLGYWIGYKITNAYYNKAADKAQAIEDILTITDFDRFLEQSGLVGNP